MLLVLIDVAGCLLAGKVPEGYLLTLSSSRVLVARIGLRFAINLETLLPYSNPIDYVLDRLATLFLV